MKINKSRFVGETIIIAALYVLLTIVSDMFGMATSPLRFRISEALCILPYYTGAAIPGLFVGSLMSNMVLAFKGASETAFVIPTSVILDVIFCSLGTLVASVIAYLIRKTKWFVPAPNIIISMLVIPYSYIYVRRFEDYSFIKYMFMTGIGEVVTSGLLGIALLLALEDYRTKLFPRADIIIKPSENSDSVKKSESNMDKKNSNLEKLNLGVENLAIDKDLNDLKAEQDTLVNPTDEEQASEK